VVEKEVATTCSPPCFFSKIGNLASPSTYRYTTEAEEDIFTIPQLYAKGNNLTVNSSSTRLVFGGL